MIAAEKGNNDMARILLREGKCNKDQVDGVNYEQYIFIGAGNWR